ncbi:protein tweety [Linepithema humile]|uniref:protein tweety n=1 Tax=Linepithema humile TaxID=83485 RepID=UPI0006235EF0|nr:PREDICTED: LOW QUALITY PROTEIN: uncharacterized protein LOC105675466 [Linepithema humile]
MYAAAGGASIANRRKQKRLQLNKQTPVNVVPPRLKGVPPGSRQQQQQHQHHHHQHQHQHHHQFHHHHQHQHNHHHHHHHHPTKFATRPHQVASASQAPRAHPQAPTSTSSSSAAFHSAIDDRRRRADHRKSQQVVPVSPIQFPISPPPLSLESSASATTCPPASKPSNFPFPPPSILDLRVSPPTSELQCGGQGPSGKAAWQGCSRPSPLPLSPISPGCRGDAYNARTKQCEAHRRWMKRNRIRDASYCYGSSGEDDEEDDSSNAIRQRGEVSAAVNTVLYVGLGTTALGLVISFVGTGEKGFLSPQLRLVGPSLLCAGLLCCLFRVLLCLCLCRCGQCRWRFCHVASQKKEKARKADTHPGPGTLPTASLLSPMQQQERPCAAPTSRSVSPATKGHELLLSPAQLPE